VGALAIELLALTRKAPRDQPRSWRLVGFLQDVRATKLPAAIVDVYSKLIESILDAVVAPAPASPRMSVSICYERTLQSVSAHWRKIYRRRRFISREAIKVKHHYLAYHDACVHRHGQRVIKPSNRPGNH